ncbi:MAG: LytR/AlgR family response regulator transcription factor, partial [Lachnospiraceae bacterium]
MENKLTIGICDDNPMAIKQIREIVEKYLVEKDIKANITAFDGGKELLTSEWLPDILFLDIEMPGEDGIQTGKTLRERGSDCRIIMATGMRERFKEGFHIGAVRFVTKPFAEAEVREALEHALQSFIGMHMVILHEKRIPHPIPEKYIRYIQAYDGYAEAVVGKEGKRMRTEKSLNRLEEELDKRLFYRVSREHLVNFTYIDSYSNGVLAVGEKRLRVSRRNKKEFERLYREYDLY